MPDDVVNARGELTFAEQTRLLYTPQGTERHCTGHPWYCDVHDEWFDCSQECPRCPQWYDVPPGPPVLPVVDDSDWGRNR